MLPPPLLARLPTKRIRFVTTVPDLCIGKRQRMGSRDWGEEERRLKAELEVGGWRQP
jgi:hypothetical protein